ncbi:MAG: DUF1214 domain-containing protein [Hyphomicrobiales bacterium]|nr:DUF1214 domain-containing protein [Hyphomicrobiales bacterium]
MKLSQAAPFSQPLDEEMRTPISVYALALATLLAGFAIGLFITDLTVGRLYLFGAARSGAWIAWPKTGALDPDPYARATMTRDGIAPLGNGEGLFFLAQTDDAGRALSGNCDYMLTGDTPAARFWTLTVYGPGGRLVADAAGPTHLLSSAVLRNEKGQASITVARSARAGNWLAAPREGSFALALTLYDASASATPSAIANLGMPKITRGDCQ